jgi:aerobic-type carbon monoxide dehydrogenase small subunit (CoxS/CutS family)
MKLSLNNSDVTISDDYADDLLVWAIRDGAGLTGTHFGCGVGECGSCMVLIDGAATRSCQTPAADVNSASITTMEGLASGDAGAPDLHAVQKAFMEFPLQCQWCLPGHMMIAVALIEANASPTREDIETAINANLCRCGGYNQIRNAIARAVEINGGSK